jgi:hypothetical protein|tara:strand:+ start:2469 stop:2861 length:393 start_codon:yes stop_codon:yes gene_type:complete
MQKRSWSNVPGQISVELYLGEDGKLYCAHDDKKAPDELIPIVKLDADDTVELVIEFASTGYHEPSSMYGGPDNLGHPAEWDDERLLTSAYLHGSKEYPPLDKQLQQYLFGYYFAKIEDADIDTEQDDPRY